MHLVPIVQMMVTSQDYIEITAIGRGVIEGTIGNLYSSKGEYGSCNL